MGGCMGHPPSPPTYSPSTSLLSSVIPRSTSLLLHSGPPPPFFAPVSALCFSESVFFSPLRSDTTYKRIILCLSLFSAFLVFICSSRATSRRRVQRRRGFSGSDSDSLCLMTLRWKRVRLHSRVCKSQKDTNHV